MRIEYVNLDSAPDNDTIESLLGRNSYKYYLLLCETATSLSPNLEIWSGKCSQGEYYHAYCMHDKSDISCIHMWLQEKRIICKLDISQQKAKNLTEHKAQFCTSIQRSIDACNHNYEKHHIGFSVEFRLTGGNLLDALRVLRRVESLEYYYSGDKAWRDIVKLAKENFWINTVYQKELLELLNNQLDCAMVVFARLGNDSIKWIFEQLPMLDGIRPIDCLEKTHLVRRLRELLMRMH